jgi:hypothetical protein
MSAASSASAASQEDRIVICGGGIIGASIMYQVPYSHPTCLPISNAHQPCP